MNGYIGLKRNWIGTIWQKNVFDELLDCVDKETLEDTSKKEMEMVNCEIVEN
jgi:hypothetical protein